MNRSIIVLGSLALLATAVTPVLAETGMENVGAKPEGSTDKHKGMENDTQHAQHAQHVKTEQAKRQGTDTGKDSAKEPASQSAPQPTSGAGSVTSQGGAPQKDGAMPAGDMGKM